MKSFFSVLIAFAMLLATATANAAKCKYADDEVDKFTNVRTVQTKPKLVTSMMSAFGRAPKGPHAVYAGNVSSWFEGDDYFLTMRILVENYIPHEPPPYELENAIVVSEDSHLLILMADGSIERLPVRKQYGFDSQFLRPNADGNSSKNDFWKSTEAHISYVLDEPMMTVLTSQDATNMRIEAGDDYYDIEIQKKSRGDMAEVIGCIQQAHATEGAVK